MSSHVREQRRNCGASIKKGVAALTGGMTHRSSPKPPVTRSEVETARSLLIHDARTETDPARRAILLTNIEACNQRLERDFGVPHPSGVPTQF